MTRCIGLTKLVFAHDVFEYSDGTKMRLELYVPKVDNPMSNSAGSGSSRYRINNDGELINKTRASQGRRRQS